jgi:uncharacterized membrane protein
MPAIEPSTSTEGAVAALDLSDVVLTTLRTTAASAPPIAAACAIAVLPFTVVDAVSWSVGTETPAVINIVSAIVNCWLFGTIAHLALGVIQERPITLRDASSAATPLIGTVFAVNLLQGLLIAVGCVALVVPGVIAWAWSYVALPVAIFERERAGGALRRSGELVRGQWGTLLVLGLASFVGLIVVTGMAAAPLLLTILDDGGGDPEMLAPGPAAYALLLATSVAQGVYLALSTVASVVVYARLRGVHAAVDRDRIASVFL